MIGIAPVREAGLRFTWDWMQRYKKQMVDDGCPQSFEQLREKYLNDEARGSRSYEITEDSAIVGTVWFEAIRDGMFIGHLVFAKNSSPTGEKMKAVRMALADLFTHGARKVCWMFLADNRAFRIFLKRLGATWEGVFKQQTRCDGKLADVAYMASFAEEA